MDDKRLREIEDQAKGDCCIVSDPYAFDLIAEIRRLRIELKTRTTERDDARGMVDAMLGGAPCPSGQGDLRNCADCTDREPPNCLWDEAYKARDWGHDG